jgi:hypothetical protein
MIRACLFFVLCATAVDAQEKLRPAEVKRIDIQIGHCAIRPDSVELVLNDRVVESAKLQLNGHWVWSGGPIAYGVPKNAQIGVRFEGGRTRCRHHDSFPADTANVGMPEYSFPRCITGYDVTLQVRFEQRGESPYRINYVREVNADEGDKPLGSPCNERLDFPSSEPYDFLGFVNGVDKISIFLYRPKKDPEGKPFTLNPLLGNDKGLAKGEEEGPDRVAVRWLEETVKKRAMLAPNDIDIDVATLDNIHFKSLTLTFKQKK